MKNFVAVVQLGYAVFGIGENPDAAIEDAEYWADGPLNLVDLRDAVDGDMVLVECSESLFLEVSKNGGAIPFDRNETGVFCLPNEI